MGRHRKPPRIRLPHPGRGAAVAATVPALAGVAAAVALSQQAAAAPAPHSNAAAPQAQDVTTHSDDSLTSSERLQAAAREAAVRQSLQQAAAAPQQYTVQAGDTLAAIAARAYHNPADWPVLYWANHSTVKWADDIQPGQVLAIPAQPAHVPGPPAQVAPPAASPVPAGTSNLGSGSGYVPRHASTQTVVAQSGDGHVPGGAFGQCVESRESGGQSQVMNASGHYGLYQFSAGTWSEYGGNPSHFGNASVAEQNQVFANALAAGGQSNWAPYDGC